MKIIKFSTLYLVIVLFSACDEFAINMSYNFFTESELANIYINQDSALNLQKSVAKYKTFNEYKVGKTFYNENVIIYFQTEVGDTLKCQVLNQISIERADLLVSTSTKTVASSYLRALDSCFISSIEYSITKPSSSNEDPIDRKLSFTNFDYHSGIYLSLYKSGLINNDKTYFTVSFEQFTLNNLNVDSCLFIKQFDASSNEVFRVIYSNKYGFLLIKNTQHEITRIL